MSNCQACGMPINPPRQQYCQYCSDDEEGTNLTATKEGVIKATTKYYVDQGMSKDKAAKKAKKDVSKLEAWKNK